MANKRISNMDVKAREVIAALGGMLAIMDAQGVILAFEAFGDHRRGLGALNLQGQMWFEHFESLEIPPDSRTFFYEIALKQPGGHLITAWQPSRGEEESCFIEWHFKHMGDLQQGRHRIMAVGLDVTAQMKERKAVNAQEEALRGQIRHADRLATIGQLAAGIAHELNNPLTDILGFAQLAANSPDLSEQTYGDIIKIVQSALYAREVIKKILLFSRQTHPKETKANLNHLVRDWKGFIDPRCAQNNIEVVLALYPDLPDMAGDASQLNQVLINLVTNAIHAMPQGGRLTIETDIQDHQIVLRVIDTGTGIPKEIRDKIFLPFFTTKEVDKGTGLGLSVVYGIVKEHGGTIQMESAEGRGTVFEVRFPREIDHGSASRE